MAGAVAATLTLVIDPNTVAKLLGDIQRNLRDTALDIETIVLSALAVIQLGVYYDLWDDALDDRDDMINRQEIVRDDLHRRDIDVDVPRLALKQGAIDIAIPEPDLCGDALAYTDESMKDGVSIDDKAIEIGRQVSGGIPVNWGVHGGQLLAAKAGSYTSGILVNSAKRRKESFRNNKTNLVLNSNSASRLSVGPVLQDLGQATAIHAGMSDIFAAGFNSAGASLGVLAGRLAG